MLIKGVEGLTYNWHGEANILLAALHLPKYLHLDIEQLFKLQPFACLLHRRGVLREMDIAKCLAQSHQVVALHYIHTHGIYHALLL